MDEVIGIKFIQGISDSGVKIPASEETSEFNSGQIGMFEFQVIHYSATLRGRGSIFHICNQRDIFL